MSLSDENELTEQDYADLEDPVLDLNMVGIGEGDSDENLHVTEENQGGTIDEKRPHVRKDDFYYSPKDVSAMINDLRNICDASGVSCTAPMESQVKQRIKNETVYYSSLLWYVRGISTANQTQILPTVTGAISDMKMETRYLQQASSKLNKEIIKTETVASKIYAELRSVQEEMQDSFRRSMKLFMEDVLSTVATEVPRGEVKREDTRTVGDIIDDKGRDDDHSLAEETGRTPEKGKQVVINPEKMAVSYNVEKRSRMIRFGIDPAILKTLDDDTINLIYPDSVHNQLKNMRPTEDVKNKLSDQILSRLEALMDSASEDESEADEESSVEGSSSGGEEDVEAGVSTG